MQIAFSSAACMACTMQKNEILGSRQIINLEEFGKVSQLETTDLIG